MARYYVIVNPVSGRGDGERAIPTIHEKLREYGLDYELARTEHPWHAAELALDATRDGYDVVVAVGGDGTANEVLNGIMLAKLEGASTPAMGFVGVGRGNDFAFGVGVPNGLEVGLEILAQNDRKRIDVGRVRGGMYPDGRYFGNGIGIGFDAVVGFEAQKITRLHGFPNYIVAALKTMFLYFRAPEVRIVLDEEELTLPAIMVSVMNGRRMGGGFMMAPTAKADDGLLNLCIAEQVSRLKILQLIVKFMGGTQESDAAIHTRQAKRVVITALDGTLPAHADGETLCIEGQELSVELLPAQLEVVSPSLEGSA
jgi:diacylglycerol kinase (ATP)